METHFYNTIVDWKEGRKGMMSSPELNDSFMVATPPNFKKGEADIWSPEHLFTAAINSCLMTTFLAIAENSGLKFNSFRCEAKGKLEMVDGKYLMTEVGLFPSIVIEHEADIEKAEKILQKAERACLISASVKSKIKMTTRIDIAAALYTM